MNKGQEKIVNQFKIENAKDLKYIVSEDLKFIHSEDMDKLIKELINSIDRGDNIPVIHFEGLSELYLQKIYKLYDLLKLAQ